MSQYDNQGYLFFKHGKFTGKLTIDGVEHRLEGFWKEKNGRKDELISLARRTEEQHKDDRQKEKARKQGYEYEGPVDEGSLHPCDIQGDNPELSDVPF